MYFLYQKFLRLCHVNKHISYNLINLALIIKLSINDLEKCELFNPAKVTKTSRKLIIIELEPIDILHSNICDDFSDYIFVYLVKNKSEAFDLFKTYVNEIENQFH